MSMVLALLVVVLAAPPAAAQGRLDAVAAGVDRAITPAAEPAALQRMATFLGTTPDALRTERASTRLGWGDVFISHRIATRGGHPLEKVFAARRTGAEWEQIAGEARVEPDALVQDVAARRPVGRGLRRRRPRRAPPRRRRGSPVASWTSCAARRRPPRIRAPATTSPPTAPRRRSATG
jgi:hypothetical protein